MPIIHINKLSIEDVEENPECIFVFSENCDEKGGSAFVRELRDCENSLGIRVKAASGSQKSSYFNEDDFGEAEYYINEAFMELEDHLKSGAIVVFRVGEFEDDTKLEDNSFSVYSLVLEKITELRNM